MSQPAIDLKPLLKFRVVAVVLIHAVLVTFAWYAAWWLRIQSQLWDQHAAGGTDYIYLRNCNELFPVVLANQLRGRSSGGELTAIAHLSPSWVLRGGYSYLSLDLEAAPGSTDTTSVSAEGASPRNAARLQSTWRLPRDVDVDIGLRWVDHLPAQKVPAYTALDARVSWLVVPRLELAVVGHDLLHARHLEFGGTIPIEIERSVYGEARLRW